MQSYKEQCMSYHEYRFLGHEWGALPIIFTNDEVMSENHWQVASRVTQKLLFTVTNILYYFLHAIWWVEHTIPLKQLSITDVAIVAKHIFLWLSIVTSPQLICDVTQMWGTGIVMSYSSIVLACTNWHKGDLHWWITTVNTGIHSLVCKKFKYKYTIPV